MNIPSGEDSDDRMPTFGLTARSTAPRKHAKR
jgi:hypothetical protein